MIDRKALKGKVFPWLHLNGEFIDYISSRVMLGLRWRWTSLAPCCEAARHRSRIFAIRLAERTILSGWDRFFYRRMDVGDCDDALVGGT